MVKNCPISPISSNSHGPLPLFLSFHGTTQLHLNHTILIKGLGIFVEVYFSKKLVDITESKCLIVISDDQKTWTYLMIQNMIKTSLFQRWDSWKNWIIQALLKA